MQGITIFGLETVCSLNLGGLGSVSGLRSAEMGGRGLCGRGILAGLGLRWAS